MADNKGSKKNNGKYEVKTSMLFQTYEFVWTLENFSQWPDTFEETSEEFQPAKDIILYAKFERYVDDSEDWNCHLRLISKGKTSFKMKHILSVVGSDGKIFDSGEIDTYDEHTKFNYKCDVYPEKIKEFCDSTEDQIVIFKFVLEISALATKNVHRHLPLSSSDLLPTVIEDFKSMFSNSLYTDLTLSVGDSVLRVHRSVLAARSPVFAKKLKSPSPMSEKDVIVFSGVDLPILKIFIEFLYTGRIPDAEGKADAEFETMCNLYYAAYMYEVKSLQKECANVLLAKLNVENSCQVLALAARCFDQELKGLVLHFMQSEFDELLGTESWIEFVETKFDLAKEVMKLRAQKLKKRSSS